MYKTAHPCVMIRTIKLEKIFGKELCFINFQVYLENFSCFNLAHIVMLFRCLSNDLFQESHISGTYRYVDYCSLGHFLLEAFPTLL